MSLAPVTAELKSARFRREREDDWRRLEGLLKRLETQPVSKLSDEELIALPVLYRATLSALSVARETTLDKALLDYLEGLCTRAYFVVYGARPRLSHRLTRFFAADWPSAARALWRETAIAGLLFALGSGIAFWLYGRDPDWFFAFIPGGMAQGRDPSATTEALRKVLYDGGPQRPDRHFRLCARLCLWCAHRAVDGDQRLFAGRPARALRRSWLRVSTGRLAGDPRRDGNLRHLPGRRGRLPHRLDARLSRREVAS
jgi:hypothetical protein